MVSWPSWWSDERCGRDLINRYIFVHLTTKGDSVDDDLNFESVEEDDKSKKKKKKENADEEKDDDHAPSSSFSSSSSSSSSSSPGSIPSQDPLIKPVIGDFYSTDSSSSVYDSETDMSESGDHKYRLAVMMLRKLLLFSSGQIERESEDSPEFADVFCYTYISLLLLYVYIAITCVDDGEWW
jgi:hypothetical protein